VFSGTHNSPKTWLIFKICTCLDSARQGEEGIEAGFFDIALRRWEIANGKICVRSVLLGMPAKTSESCMAPPNLQLRRSTKKVSQQSHCGIAPLCTWIV
jgi:hypothetical protein